jgi:DNA mismatch repair protein MutL
VETRAVSDAVVTLALTNPGVGISMRSDDRVLVELPATRDLVERVRGIWGTELADQFLPLEGGGPVGGLRGLVQRPDAVRPGHRRAFLFVNGRAFRDSTLLRALDRGYRTTVPPGSRAWAFLYLDVPDGAVDVNVHPAKAEVRFREMPAVEALVEGAVREALAGGSSSAAIGAPGESPASLLVREGRGGGSGRAGQGGPRSGGVGGSAERDRASQMALFVPSPLRTREEEGGSGIPGESGGRPATEPLAEGAAAGDSREPGEGRIPRAEGDPVAGPNGPFPAEDDALRSLTAERPRLWQVLDTYILAEVRDGLLIIDQHSAHERVLFEELMDRFDGEGQGGQRLLFPLTIRLTPAEYEQVEAMEGLLARSGFEVEGFGGDTVIVQAVPDPHPYFDGERCFREMIRELTEGSELVRSARNQHERIAKTFACKGAIKAGQSLSEVEMQELFDRLFATELPFHDVHGRPTIVRLSGRELDRKFNR